MLHRPEATQNYKKRASHYDFDLTIHLILKIKYKRNILSELGEDLVKNISGLTKTPNFEIKEIQYGDNYISLVIDFAPKISVSRICKSIKLKTTKWAWNVHEGTCRKYFWKPGRKMLWTDGYFVRSVENV